MLQMIVLWVTSQLSAGMDFFCGLFFKALNVDAQGLVNLFPVLGTGYKIFSGIGYGLVFVFAVIGLMQFFVPAVFGGRQPDDRPLGVLFKAALATLLVFSGNYLLGYIIELAKIPLEGFAALNTTGGFSFNLNYLFTTDGTLEESALLDQLTVLNLVLTAIVIYSVARVLFDTCRRYLRVSILFYTSPPFFAMVASNSTLNLFKTWIKTFISSCAMMAVSVFFIKIILSGMVSIYQNFSNLGEAFVKIVFLIAACAAAQHMDDFIAKFGLGGTVSARALWDDFAASYKTTVGMFGGIQTSGSRSTVLGATSQPIADTSSPAGLDRRQIAGLDDGLAQKGKNPITEFLVNIRQNTEVKQEATPVNVTHHVVVPESRSDVKVTVEQKIPPQKVSAEVSSSAPSSIDKMSVGEAKFDKVSHQQGAGATIYNVPGESRTGGMSEANVYEHHFTGGSAGQFTADSGSESVKGNDVVHHTEFSGRASDAGGSVHDVRESSEKVLESSERVVRETAQPAMSVGAADVQYVNVSGGIGHDSENGYSEINRMMPQNVVQNVSGALDNVTVKDVRGESAGGAYISGKEWSATYSDKSGESHMVSVMDTASHEVRKSAGEDLSAWSRQKTVSGETVYVKDKTVSKEKIESIRSERTKETYREKSNSVSERELGEAKVQNAGQSQSSGNSTEFIQQEGKGRMSIMEENRVPVVSRNETVKSTIEKITQSEKTDYRSEKTEPFTKEFSQKENIGKQPVSASGQNQPLENRKESKKDSKGKIVIPQKSRKNGILIPPNTSTVKRSKPDNSNSKNK